MKFVSSSSTNVSFKLIWVYLVHFLCFAVQFSTFDRQQYCVIDTFIETLSGSVLRFPLQFETFILYGIKELCFYFSESYRLFKFDLEVNCKEPSLLALHVWCSCLGLNNNLRFC